jgi:hypothetical protein
MPLACDEARTHHGTINGMPALAQEKESDGSDYLLPMLLNQ